MQPSKPIYALIVVWFTSVSVSIVSSQSIPYSTIQILTVLGILATIGVLVLEVVTVPKKGDKIGPEINQETTTQANNNDPHEIFKKGADSDNIPTTVAYWTAYGEGELPNALLELVEFESDSQASEEVHKDFPNKNQTFQSKTEIKDETKAYAANPDPEIIETLEPNETEESDEEPEMVPYQDIPDHSIIELISSSGNSEIYKIRLDSGRIAALKMPKLGTGTISRETFERYSKMWKSHEQISDHDNILDIFQWGMNPTPWILIEYMNMNLHYYMRENSIHPRNIISQICDGLGYAHEMGIIHGDLKPSNVLVSMNDGGVSVKISDWGNRAILSTGRSIGLEAFTPAYATPEHLAEKYGPITKKTDIYQLSVITYEVLSGERPYDNSSTASILHSVLEKEPIPPSNHNPNIPNATDEMILKSMSKIPEERHESVPKYCEELTNTLIDGV